MKSGSAATTEQVLKYSNTANFSQQKTPFSQLNSPLFFTFLFCGYFALVSTLLRVLLTSTLLGMPEEPTGRPEEQL